MQSIKTHAATGLDTVAAAGQASRDPLSRHRRLVVHHDCWADAAPGRGQHAGAGAAAARHLGRLRTARIDRAGPDRAAELIHHSRRLSAPSGSRKSHLD